MCSGGAEKFLIIFPAHSLATSLATSPARSRRRSSYTTSVRVSTCRKNRCTVRTSPPVASRARVIASCRSACGRVGRPRSRRIRKTAVAVSRVGPRAARSSRTNSGPGSPPPTGRPPGQGGARRAREGHSDRLGVTLAGHRHRAPVEVGIGQVECHEASIHPECRGRGCSTYGALDDPRPFPLGSESGPLRTTHARGITNEPPRRVPTAAGARSVILSVKAVRNANLVGRGDPRKPRRVGRGLCARWSF